ncbi:MAG TPA: deoxyguanosinetriphosphate triphosphohydrolase [Deinococcales bacterium]|nr:deoxyguanosinetriphosphate triphosphohydrolase [Deinococcales bacterium]
MATRELIEARERATLAPYAVLSAESRGRQYPERLPEYRTAFQKDRDRVLHTTAFRRLEYKTQVFVNYEGDYYRTRLTHTLEVAQVARTLARALCLNEDLAETIALAHDLGHPPFGHAGERILDGLLAGHGGFDHNKQTLRIVTELEERYPDFVGLNLSWETLEGIVKHETDFDRRDAAEFEPGWCASLEAQIANVADDTAYDAHDLDDGLRSGLIEGHDLDGLRVWDRFMQELGLDSGRLTELDRRVLVRELLGWMITDLVHESERNLTAANVRTLGNVRSQPEPLVRHSTPVAEELRELKDFLFKNLYRHHRVERQVHKAEHVVSSLYRAYTARPTILPPSVQARFETTGLERAACDYLAGMTDRFAMDEFKRLFDPYERT